MKTLRNALRTSDFVLTAELALDDSLDRTGIERQLDIVRECVDAVQVSDAPRGKLQIAPLAASAILLENGVDPVMHLSCRDRNRVALRSELLGAAALGVTSLLLRRGDNAAQSVKPVLDWTVTELIGAARAMDETAPFGHPAGFNIGTAAVAFKPDQAWEPANIREKSRAGANYVQTQMCFDIDVLRHYVARLVEQKLIENVDVIVSIAPLPSADVADWLGKNLQGAAVPAKIVRRMRSASDQKAEGIAICAEVIAACRDTPGVAGANLVSFGDMPAVCEAIAASGIRA